MQCIHRALTLTLTSNKIQIHVHTTDIDIEPQTIGITHNTHNLVVLVIQACCLSRRVARAYMHTYTQCISIQLTCPLFRLVLVWHQIIYCALHISYYYYYDHDYHTDLMRARLCWLSNQRYLNNLFISCAVWMRYFHFGFFTEIYFSQIVVVLSATLA